MHPLEVAQKVLVDSVGKTEPVVKGNKIYFDYNDKTGAEYYEGMIQDYESKKALVVGVMPDIAMHRWRGCATFFKSLAQQLEPFLCQRYGDIGRIQLYGAKKMTTFAYEVPVFYSSLEGQELYNTIHTGLVRSMRAIALLRPVLVRMIETSVTPTVADSLQEIEREHGRWEIVGFTDGKEDKRIHMPRGMYENYYPRDPNRLN